MVEQEQHIQSVMVRALLHVYPALPGCDHGPSVEPGAEPVPLPRWRALVEHLLQAHFPGVPRAEALRAVARAVFDFYIADPTGAPMASMLEMGPEKFLVRAPLFSQRFVLAGSWRVTPLAPGHIEARVEAYPLPSEYLAGLIEQALTRAGGLAVAAEVVSESGSSLELDIRFHDPLQPRARPA